MATRWYVYYKVAEPDASQCIAAARDVQTQLRARHAGLQAELLRRPSAGSDGCITLMETYHGIEPDLMAEVEACVQAALKRWTVGARHHERFTRCD